MNCARPISTRPRNGASCRACAPTGWPTPTWSACRSTRRWRCSPARAFRPTSAGSTRYDAAPAGRLCLDFAENIDLDGAGEHVPPGLQERLQARVAGDLLAAGLERFVD